MLLMPTDLVRRIVDQLTIPTASAAGVREVARRLRTSFKATLEHMKNLDFLSEEEHDRVQLEVGGID
jgi:BMFP domain-containing protein YqiC